ncbi:GMC oxidoreductase [Sphaerobolus stellatus SS14]|nr:GMC oxidoreductase [Sphaerobolus stellatus SS14]
MITVDTTTPGSSIPMLSFFPLQRIATEETIDLMEEELDRSLSRTTLTLLQQAQSEIVILGIQRVARTDFVTLFLATQHPYSRGSVHIQSKDPLEKPNVDPNFLGSAFDLRVIRAFLKSSRTFVATELVKDYLLEYTQPAGIEDLTEGDQFDKYIRSSVGVRNIIYHDSPTFDAFPVCVPSKWDCSMAPRELGGVADTSLRAYETQSLRIVDASVFPLHITTHPLATIYAPAEKASDIVKAKAHQ